MGNSGSKGGGGSSNSGGSNSGNSGGYGSVYKIPGGSSNDRVVIRAYDQSGKEVRMPNFDKPSYPSGNGREGLGSGGNSSNSGNNGNSYSGSKTQERFADFSGHLGLNSSGQCNVSELFFSRSISVENVTSLSLVGTKMGLNSAKYISPLLSHKNFHFCSMNLTKNQLGDEGVAYMILEKAVGVVEQFKIC
jgi:hypothetical protein